MPRQFQSLMVMNMIRIFELDEEKNRESLKNNEREKTIKLTK